MERYTHSKLFIEENNKAINKLGVKLMKHKHINKGRIKILLKNGYNEIDIQTQTIIKPNGTTEKIPQWDIDHYMNVHKFQKIKGIV